MLAGQGRATPALPTLEPFEAVELELALDLEDLRDGFPAAVRRAAGAVGGSMLFEAPSDGSIPDASRIAAVRLGADAPPRILFAILDADGARVRVAGRDEVGERLTGLARAYVGVVDRLRAPAPNRAPVSA